MKTNYSTFRGALPRCPAIGLDRGRRDLTGGIRAMPALFRQEPAEQAPEKQAARLGARRHGICGPQKATASHHAGAGLPAAESTCAVLRELSWLASARVCVYFVFQDTHAIQIRFARQDSFRPIRSHAPLPTRSTIPARHSRHHDFALLLRLRARAHRA